MLIYEGVTMFHVLLRRIGLFFLCLCLFEMTRVEFVFAGWKENPQTLGAFFNTTQNRKINFLDVSIPNGSIEFRFSIHFQTGTSLKKFQEKLQGEVDFLIQENESLIQDDNHDEPPIQYRTPNDDNCCSCSSKRLIIHVAADRLIYLNLTLDTLANFDSIDRNSRDIRHIKSRMINQLNKKIKKGDLLANGIFRVSDSGDIVLVSHKTVTPPPAYVPLVDQGAAAAAAASVSSNKCKRILSEQSATDHNI